MISWLKTRQSTTEDTEAHGGKRRNGKPNYVCFSSVFLCVLCGEWVFVLAGGDGEVLFEEFVDSCQHFIR